MRSQCDTQLGGLDSARFSADYRRPTPPPSTASVSGAPHQLHDGGALQRFLASALAALLTLVFAWLILFTEETRGESRDEKGASTRAATGRDCTAGRCSADAASTSINQLSVSGGSADAVTHDNATTDCSTVPLQQPPPGHAAARRPTPPAGSWKLTSSSTGRAPAEHPLPSVTDSVLHADMPSRNCARAVPEQIRVSSYSEPLSTSNGVEFSPAGGRSGESTDSLSPATLDETTTTGAELQPSFRRRPLMWSTSTDGNDEPPPAGSPCSCSSDDLDFFHALMDPTQNPAECQVDQEDDDENRKSVGRDEDDDGDDEDTTKVDLPQVTTSTWISLFRTFFMGQQEQQERSKASPVTEARSRDVVSDLLDRTLSTISEEAGDELTKKMSELDDDLLHNTWQREPEDAVNSSSYFEDDEDDVFYSDSNMCQLANDAVRSPTQWTVDDTQTTTNNDQNNVTGDRGLTTTTTTTTKTFGEATVCQGPCTVAASNVVGRRSFVDGSLSCSDRPLFAEAAVTAPCSNQGVDTAALALFNPCPPPEVSEVTGSGAEEAQTSSSACARCTAAVTHYVTLGDEASLDVPANTVLALSTASGEAFARDRNPHVAAARAATQAASSALSQVILQQVRELANGTTTISDALELELTARCLVRCRGRLDADGSRHENQVSPEVFAGADVTSGLQIGGCGSPKVKSGSTQRRSSDVASQQQFDRRPGEVTDAPVVAVDRLTSTACAIVSRGIALNAPLTTSRNERHVDNAMTTGAADLGGNYGRDECASAVFPSEAIADNKNNSGNSKSVELVDDLRQIDDHRRRIARQHENIDSLPVDFGPSSLNVDAGVTSYSCRHRSVPKHDVIDAQSTSSASSLLFYEQYAQSPGSRRRQQQRQRRRQHVDEDFVGSTQSPRDASRHCRRAPAAPGRQQVTSSFENLVGGLLAVPQCSRRHLVNSDETLTVTNSSGTVLAAPFSDGALAGHGAEFPGPLTVLVAAPGLRRDGRLSVVHPSAEPTPALPLNTKPAAPPQHGVRRAKLLFKSCKSCVRRQRPDDVAAST